ncbi:MAG: hypothetical protein ABH882_00735 [Candidatus Omnitrophota bacterium]|nr:hypothetical protein [Candidatus Omnitrophota bacterium]MBU1928900.1 hypothetical protein [Candidatus Omnitrophota bacterium]MBU2034510.1 hypothetical protein [Candidatus Omnitrophota bacterium]MBU2221442.1 hypothetical protein [Candidatus Omnitrophota bacterium]MBU2258592.1 hypothetical protein [Candidatus Omnitrophota bacterium]
MNDKQIIVVLGLIAYIAGGLTVVILNLETYLQIIRSQINVLTPIFITFSIILIVGITLIYLFRSNKGQ